MSAPTYKIFDDQIESVEIFADALSKNPYVTNHVDKRIFTLFLDSYTGYICIVFSEQYKRFNQKQAGVILITLSSLSEDKESMKHKHRVEDFLNNLPSSLKVIFTSNLDLFTNPSWI